MSKFETLKTTYGSFQAHIRREEIDIEKNGNFVAAYPKYDAIQNLRGRRRFAEFLSSSASKLKAPMAASIVAYDSGVGILKGDSKRVLRGLVLGVATAVALGQAETVFQKDADLAGIHQEAIEESS